MRLKPSNRTTKRVLRAICKHRKKILKVALRTVKAISKQMQSLNDSKNIKNKEATTPSIKPGEFDDEVIHQAQELLTEIKDGYQYWDDPSKFFEVLNPEAKTYELFSKFPEFSHLEELMERYEMAGVNLSSYLKQLN